jgi:hypothetical protein
MIKPINGRQFATVFQKQDEGGDQNSSLHKMEKIVVGTADKVLRVADRNNC